MGLAWLSSGSVVLPALPTLPKGHDLRPVAFSLIQQSISRQSPGCKISAPMDSHYVAVPVSLLKGAVEWTFSKIDKLGLRYRPEVYDCDDFASEFERTLVYIFAKAGQPGKPATGRILVNQQYAWGGVAAGGLHALNCIETEAGLWIVEPQSRDFCACPVETYPNRTRIYAADNF